MSRPNRMPSSDARGSRHASRPEKAESKEESSGDDSSGSVPMRHLAVGSGSAPRPGNRQGARIISGIRDRAAAAGSDAAAAGPAATPQERDIAAVCEDRAQFGKLVADPVAATVALAGSCSDRTVQAMAARLQEALDALTGKLPERRDELARALTDLLRYQDTVAREASEIARLRDTEPATTVKFGTEITFSDPSLHALTVDPTEKVDRTALKKAQQAARGYLDEWTRTVVRMFPTDRKKGLVLDVSPASPQSIEGAMRFTFSAPGFDATGNPVQLSWWYQTNIDNACLELQMAPTTLADFADGMIGKWAQSIFEVAGGLGLQSGAAGMGGGHLSMDRASSFGDSTILFARMVRLYNDMAKAGDIHAAYADDDAPFLRDMDKNGGGKLAGDYDTLMKRVEDSLLDPASAMSVDEVRDQLWNLLKRAKPLKEKLNNAGRYTALNIEPVTEDDPAKQRVEFRRFQGQTSVDELCEQLGELLKLAEQARRG